MDRLEASEAKLKAMIDGLELQNTEDATPESLKLTCQIVALAAKKYDPMKATLAAIGELPDKWRDSKYDEQQHTSVPIAQVKEWCANELQAILNRSKE